MSFRKVVVLGNLTADSGKVHQYSAIIHTGGVSPALLAVNYKDPVRVLMKLKNERPNNVHPTSD